MAKRQEKRRRPTRVAVSSCIDGGCRVCLEVRVDSIDERLADPLDEVSLA